MSCRLPTESEWEYMSRAGSKTSYFWDETDIASDYAVYNDKPEGEIRAATSKVKTKNPNDFNLYDVTGNVSEWTQDCHVGTYAGAPVNGEAFEFEACSSRVTRGGSFDDGIDRLRLAHRIGVEPDVRGCLLYTSPSPRDQRGSRMPSSA